MMRYIPGSMMKVQRTTNSVYSSNRTYAYDTYCVYHIVLLILYDSYYLRANCAFAPVACRLFQKLKF